MSYEYLKALHIIFVVTWFAGLFYIVRLFIYHREAMDKSLEEKKILIPQYQIMEKRLWYGITWPSAIVTLIFGLSLISNWMPITDHPWLIWKLAFVIGLFSYHLICHWLFKKLQKDEVIMSSYKLRIWNEVATLFLFAIVFLVVVKDELAWLKGIIGLLVLGVVLMMAIKFYRKRRLK